MAIARWDQEALAEVYRRNAGPVFGLARRVLGDAAVAEEVVQEVFLRLWHEPGRYDPERGSLRTFLLSQVHSRSIDMLRSDSARRQREVRDARSTASGQYDVEHEFLDIAVAEGVRDALGVLQPGERSAIELAYFGGPHLQRGGRHPRRARGHDQKPHPFRDAANAVIARGQRNGRW